MRSNDQNPLRARRQRAGEEPEIMPNIIDEDRTRVRRRIVGKVSAASKAVYNETKPKCRMGACIGPLVSSNLNKKHPVPWSRPPRKEHLYRPPNFDFPGRICVISTDDNAISPINAVALHHRVKAAKQGQQTDLMGMRGLGLCAEPGTFERTLLLLFEKIRPTSGLPPDLTVVVTMDLCDSSSPPGHCDVQIVRIFNFNNGVRNSFRLKVWQPDKKAALIWNMSSEGDVDAEQLEIGAQVTSYLQNKSLEGWLDIKWRREYINELWSEEGGYILLEIWNEFVDPLLLTAINSSDDGSSDLPYEKFDRTGKLNLSIDRNQD